MANKPNFKIAQIERSGSKIILPHDISYENAIHMIMRQMKYERETVSVDHVFDISPWDGALSLARVLDQLYGSLPPSYATEQTMFGKVRVNPKMHAVASGPNGKTTQVPWGVYTIPMLGADEGTQWQAHLETEFHREGNPFSGFSRMMFKITGEVRRMHEQDFQEIVRLVEADLKIHSIYRHQAFRLRLADDNGEPKPFPEVSFMDVSRSRIGDLILPAVSQEQITTNLFTPLQKTEQLRKLGIPLRRGVLLAGPFGVGKTLTANITASLAIQNGWTFVYVEHAQELSSVLRFVGPYQPAVVFCEDIDRVVTGERTTEMDALMNVIDGVDGKDNDVMIVLTTNNVEEINPVMLRPGRLDAVIDVQLPDEDATRRLLHKYGRGLVDPDDSLKHSAKALAGNVPAMLREVVERAKLFAISRQSESSDRIVISDSDLLAVAHGMETHRRLLTPKAPDKRSDIEKAMMSGAQILVDGIHGNGNGHDKESLVTPQLTS